MIEFGDNQNLYGTTQVGERGQIVICKNARDSFNIKPGDTLAVIATKKKGIILIKAENMLDFAHILENNAE